MLSHRIRKLAESLAPTAVMLVFNEDGQVLILKRGHTAPWYPGYWNFPGGGIDPGEAPKAAAIRELKEETNLSPATVRRFRHLINRAEMFELHAYVTKGYRGKLHLDKSENTEYAWVGPDDYDTYRYVPEVEGLLRAVL